MKTILGYVILASKDVLGVLMQFFTNQVKCLKCVESYQGEREKGSTELLFVPQNFRYYPCQKKKKDLKFKRLISRVCKESEVMKEQYELPLISWISGSNTTDDNQIILFNSIVI